MPSDLINQSIKAAQYVRMSTDYQQYSTQNQYAKIAEYALERNIEIVQTYADEGKSGLSIGGRSALQKLISDVSSGVVHFKVILVYDISRWGRFQDADESAYYEYICRRAGIAVTYCAEQFENDGSPVSTIVKGVKRAMAGEYSRELSTKVFIGQCRLVEKGFWQGGPAGLGLRRVLIDQSGLVKGELKRGEHKSIQTDRVILMPAPQEEVQIVNDMYTWLIRDDLAIGEIADRLNFMGIRTDFNNPWNYSTVRRVLTNEKYIGTNLYNRHSYKLKKQRVKNPNEILIRKEDAFFGIVDKEVFATAQNILAKRSIHLTNEEMLERLRSILKEEGQLTSFLIDQAPEAPYPSTYAHRFGSLHRAFELIGFRPPRDMRYVEIKKRLQQLHLDIIERIENSITNVGGDFRRDPKTGLIYLNQNLSVKLVLVRRNALHNGLLRWHIRIKNQPFARYYYCSSLGLV